MLSAGEDVNDTEFSRTAGGQCQNGASTLDNDSADSLIS